MKPSEPMDRSQGRFDLTTSQLPIWTGQKLHPEAPLYNMAVAFTIAGGLDINAFGQAFGALLDGSDALRSIIKETDGVPSRHVLSHVSYALDRIDFSDQSDPQAAYQAWLENRVGVPFDLERRLFDAALVQLAEDSYVWYLNLHHLVTDGWSTALVHRRMAQLYRLALDGHLDEAAATPQFSDYTTDQATRGRTTAFGKAENHWRKKTDAAPNPSSLYGRPPQGNTPHSERVLCDLGPARTQQLKAIAVEKDVRSLTPDLSLFTVFSTLLFAYLHRVSNQESLAFATPTHNRPTASSKETIGLFIELFPLQTKIEAEESFVSLLKKVRQETNSFLLHAQAGTGGSAAKACNVVLNFINASFDDFCGLPVQVDWIHPGCSDAGHALRLQVHDFSDTGSLTLHFDFNCELFDQDLRRRAPIHFLNLVDAFIEDRAQPIGRTSLLAPQEHRLLLEEFNRTDTPAPPQPTVTALFAEQVIAHPGAVAIVCGKRHLSYRQLDEQANQVAHFLKQHGVGPGVFVGLYLERSIDLIIAVLATLKAGGAYVPLDVQFPTARLAFVLRDASISLVLTHRHLCHRLPDAVKAVPMDTDESGLAGIPIADQPRTSPVPTPGAADLAYAIYTSGSTGTPKGVSVEHRSLVNYLWWARKQYTDGKALDSPLFSAVAADLTVTSMYLPLINGGKVIVYPQEDGEHDLSILRVWQEDAVDVVKLTPAHLALVRDLPQVPKRIATLVLGGEDLKTELAAAVHDRCGSIAIYNEYGPTEATVACTIHRFDRTLDTAVSVPIGRPADNARVYVLDPCLNPVTAGTTGELYIAGEGLARGYLNQPELTGQYFVADPFRPGEKMYRTGDLARWNANNNLDFLGRVDHQVKIRGIRIELGEIETELSAHAGISACVVNMVESTAEAQVRHCVRCGIPTNHPTAVLDETSTCNLCLDFDRYRDRAMAYFRPMQELHSLFDRAQAERTGDYDCLMLLSGGKDSTYVLHQLVEMGLKVLVFSLENGFISDGAKANINRAVEDLGLDLVWGETPAMNAIFADSLKRHSNVCNGCFKTIYTLSANIARQKGIKYIVTGLSRGQIFETRLAEFFQNGVADIDQIDRSIIEARKAYHRMDDAVSRHLDVKIFQDDAFFDEIQFVDFFRYCDVELDEMYEFLDQHAPWIRPADTGRSTNCLINDAGIYTHIKERGYHNYALPYSWDVRLGHKERQAAMSELEDNLDETKVQRILDEVGYAPTARTADTDRRLVAYYVAPHPLAVSDLRTHLKRNLPASMVPSHFIHLDALPLGPSGKVDHKALPQPEGIRPELEREYAAPTTPVEERLAAIWADALHLDQVGLHDNFIELGGDSILNIQIVARANQAGFQLTPKQLFDHPTVAQLATVVSTQTKTLSNPANTTSAVGPVELTPIQHWFFEQERPQAHHYNQALWLETPADLDPARLEQALEHLLAHHDALRLRFNHGPAGWSASIGEARESPAHLTRYQVPDLTAAEADATRLQTGFDLAAGNLLGAALFEFGEGQAKRLLLAVHHLAIDGVSWPILLEDLETAYNQLRAGQDVSLPAKTTSVRQWAAGLVHRANTPAVQPQTERDYWLQTPPTTAPLPMDLNPKAEHSDSASATLSVHLDEPTTHNLLRQVPQAYRTQINDVLLTALVQTLAPWTGTKALQLDLEGHGREDLVPGADLSRSVGWFTALFPLTLSLAASAQGADTGDGSKATTDIGADIKSIKEQLRRLPQRGADYGTLRYLCRSGDIAHQLKSKPPSQVLFNYLGQFDDRALTSTFNPLGPLTLFSAPGAQRQYLLEINAVVFGGRLQLDWTYSPGVHRTDTIQRLADKCIAALHRLIDHCLDPAAGGHTPSDFPLARLDQGKLDKIARLLGKKNSPGGTAR